MINKITLFRLLIIVCLFVVLKFVFGLNEVLSLLIAYVAEYILEPWLLGKN